MYFAKVLALYATDSVGFVRQAATYGIGIMAINTPKDQFPIFGHILLTAIGNSLKIANHYNEPR